MLKKLACSGSSSKATFVVIFILSLIFVGLTNSAVFAFFTGGKALQGRNLIIQIGFSIGLFLAYSILILLLFRRLIDWLLTHVYALFSIFAVLPLFSHAYIGSFIRFAADDFSSATLAVNKGILGATLDWYLNWSGRFSASFLDSIMGSLPPNAMKFETGITLLLLFIGLFSIVFQVLSYTSKYTKICTSIFLPAVILTSTFAIAPDLPQSLYWGQGMRSLIIPLVFLSFLVSGFIYFQTRHTESISPLWLVLFGFSAFFAGGFGETYVVIQTSLFGVLFIFTFFHEPAGFRKTLVLWSGVGLLCSLAAMVVIIAAPGNHIRQSYFPPSPDPVSLLAIAFRSFIDFVGIIFLSPENLVAMFSVLLSSGLVGLFLSHENTAAQFFVIKGNPFFCDFRHSLSTIFLSGILLICVCFPPAAYGMSSAPPLRTQILPGFLLTCMTAILSTCGGIFFGYRVSDFVEKSLKNRWPVFIALFFFIGFSLTMTRDVLSVAPDYRFFASRFDRADQMIRNARQNGKTSVSIPEVHNPFGLSDFGAGTTLWLDGAVDSYYGIHVIINKNMK